MKIIKKLVLGIVLTLVFIQLGCKYSFCASGYDAYGSIGYYSNWNCNDINWFLGKSINNHGSQYGGWSASYDSCCQAYSDTGYSITIRAVYETYYDSKLGTIAANSVAYYREGFGGQTYSKATSKDIRNFAASMSIADNIQGVRSALMKCFNLSKQQLSYSATLKSNNYDGSKYGGSSAKWELENQTVRQNYINYKKITKVSSDVAKAKYATVDGTEYVVMGPYKMKFGGAKIKDIRINGNSVVGTGSTRYKISGEKNINSHFNELKKNGGGAYALNNKKFYVYVKKSKIRNYIGNSNRVKITFQQDEFKYKRGRVFICNQYNAVQGNARYTQKEAVIKSGSITFEATLDDSIDIKVNKIWNDGNSKARPKSIKVTLTADGHAMNEAGDTSITKTIKSSNTCTFSGLKRYDEDGNLMKYTITENVPKNYEATYSPQSITVNKKESVYTFKITNKGPNKTDEEHTPDVGDLVINKERRRNVI